MPSFTDAEARRLMSSYAQFELSFILDEEVFGALYRHLLKLLLYRGFRRCHSTLSHARFTTRSSR